MATLHLSVPEQGGGGGESRAANSDRGLVLSVGGLGELDRGLGRGEPFFSDTDSDSDSDEAFQISRKLGLVHVEFFCVLVQQPCPPPPPGPLREQVVSLLGLPMCRRSSFSDGGGGGGMDEGPKHTQARRPGPQ